MTQIKKTSNLSPSGFTLIELMVSIAIIAILAAVGMVVYSTAQKAGRVSKRVEDLNAVKSALALYYTSNLNYPKTFDPGAAIVWRSECTGGGINQQVASSSVIPGFVPTYMPSFPADPSMILTAGIN